MHSELFSMGPFRISSYGLMLALSFFAGLAYVYKLSRREGKKFDPFLAVAYLMVIGGVVGARLFFVLFHLEDFAGNWTASFNPFASDSFGISGLNLYGGVIVAVLGILIYCYFKRYSVLEVFDYFAPTLGLGLGLTRIGCFLNGCCFGTPTELPWGVVFPAGSAPWHVFGTTHLHPSQLYSSLYGFGIFLFLHWMMKRRSFTGQLVAILFMVEAFFRFVIEYVRYYENAMHFQLLGFNPTYNQVVSISLFAAGVIIYVYRRKKGQLISTLPAA